MDEARDINWSEVARAAIRERLVQLKLFKSITAKSKLTEKDTVEISKKINKAVHERYKKEHSGAY